MPNIFKSKLTKHGYELESVNIVQAEKSDIEHRRECDPTIEMCGRRVFPVVVAPMGAVTDENNYKVWLANGFICVVPRTVDYQKRIEISKETFASFSLYEAENILDDINDGELHYICVDIAHGTMDKLYKICSRLKTWLGDKVVIMTGNVANPNAYEWYASNNIDYMRAGVGTGSRCITSCNVGVHYPTATLLDELRIKKADAERDLRHHTDIVADGGIKNFDDIQKAICLGANAVMSGRIFAKAEEASEPIVFLHPNNLDMADAIPAEDYYDKLKELRDKSDMFDSPINEYEDAYRRMAKRKPYRLYYGMSTKMAQKLTGGNGTTTSEGIAKPILVEYPIAKWAENAAAYMKSCMSYTGCRTIQEMIDNTELIINDSTDKSFRK